MGFFLSKAETDIWMRERGDHYKYITVYVDDLLIASKDPASIIEALEKKYNFKLKGTGEVKFHLECDFFRDEDNNLFYQPRKYIKKCLDTYQRIFGELPKKANSPLPKGDHPELDTTALLDVEQCPIYQSLIGSLQWAIQIGRFDVATATITLSSRFSEQRLDKVTLKVSRGSTGTSRNGNTVASASVRPNPTTHTSKTKCTTGHTHAILEPRRNYHQTCPYLSVCESLSRPLWTPTFTTT